MEKQNIRLAVYLCGVLIASIAQILLKKEACRKHAGLLSEYLNVRVITAYLMMLLTTQLTVYALKSLSVSTGAVLESFGYVFVAVLSRLFLNERTGRKSTAGYAMIIAGIIIFSMNG